MVYDDISKRVSRAKVEPIFLEEASVGEVKTIGLNFQGIVDVGRATKETSILLALVGTNDVGGWLNRKTKGKLKGIIKIVFTTSMVEIIANIEVKDPFNVGTI